MIDIHALGSSAFETQSTGGQNYGRDISLKDILESPEESKIIFDMRNDSDAWFSHFGIRMEHVMDLQLMENAFRREETSVGSDCSTGW